MPRVDMCTITTAIEIGSVDRRRALQTGPSLDPARVLFPDHAHVMELQGRRRCRCSTTASSNASTISSASSSSSRSTTSSTPPPSLARVTSAPIVAIGTTIPSTLIMARPPPNQKRAQTESARRTHNHSSNNTTIETFPPVPLTVVHPVVLPVVQQYHRRVVTADSMAMSSVSATTSTTTATTKSSSTSSSRSTSTARRPYHNVYHSYHRRNSSAPMAITSSRDQDGTALAAALASGGSVMTTNSAVTHASLLGTRPKRTLFPKEETIVLTLEGYCARESKQTIIPLSRSESVVCGTTGQNCPSITAKEYKRQARFDRRQIRRQKHLEFIPKQSLWSGEVRHYRKQFVTWRYQWTRRGRRYLASKYPKPDVTRNVQGCLC